MSDWLGVEDDYDAKKSGRGIGSWDNFEDDNDGWKGGATSSDGASSEDMLSLSPLWATMSCSVTISGLWQRAPRIVMAPV